MKKFISGILSLINPSWRMKMICPGCRLLLRMRAGGIDGHIYTNAKEALLKAKEEGFRLIEIDLILTSDNGGVAGHGWEDVRRMAGVEKNFNKDLPMRLNEFKKCVFYHRYTPLTAVEIERFFLENKDLILVTDRILEPRLLEKAFPGIKKQMIVETDIRNYADCGKSGFLKVFLNIDPPKNFKEFRAFIDLVKKKKITIEYLSVPCSYVGSKYYNILRNVYHLKFAAWTSNDPEYRRKYLQTGKIDFLYTDYLRNEK